MYEDEFVLNYIKEKNKTIKMRHAKNTPSQLRTNIEDGILRSALAGLTRLLGHKAMTVCMVIANRRAKEVDTAYKNSIDDLIKKVLERI